MRGLRYEGDALSARAERLAVELEPLSLLPGRALEIPALRVESASLALAPSTEHAEEAERAPTPAPSGLPRIDLLHLEDVTVRIPAAGGEIVVGPGRVRARDVGTTAAHLVLETPLVRTAEGREPLRAELELALDFAVPRADGPDAFRLEDVAVQLRGEAGPLASAALAGDVGADGLVALRGDVASPRPGALLDLAGIAPEALAPALAAARLEGSLAFRRERAGALVVEGGLALHGLAFEPPRAALPERLRAEGRARLAEGALALDGIVLRSEGADGADAGRVTAEGRLGFGADAETAVELAAAGVPAAAWLAVAGAALPAGAGPLRSDAELTWSGEAGGGALRGELRTALPAPGGAPDAAATPVVLRPDLRLDGARVRGTVALEGPPAREGERGEATLELDVDAAPEAPRVRVDARVASLDLTPFEPLFAGASEGAPAEGALQHAAASADEVAAESAEAGFSLEARVAVERLRLRELVAAGGTLRLETGPGGYAIRVTPTRVAGGRAELRYERRREAEGERVRFQGSAEGVSLPAVLAAFGVDPDGRIRGRLRLDVDGEGRAPPGADPLEAARGRLRFELAEAEARGTTMQQLVAAETTLDEFRFIRFGRAQGDYPIRDGAVVVDELRLDGGAVHLVVTGSVGLDRAELRVNPRVGPDLAARLPLHLAQRLAGTVLGQLAIPIVWVVEGPYGDLSYASRPAMPSLLATAFRGVTGFASWALPGGGTATAGPGDAPAPPPAAADGAPPSTPPVAAPGAGAR